MGSKGTVRHAVALGATVTATHTSTVYIVGFIALAASSQFATEKVQLYIGVAAGLMIIAMGMSLLASRALRYFRPLASDGAHRHGPFGKAHSHTPSGAAALAEKSAMTSEEIGNHLGPDGHADAQSDDDVDSHAGEHGRITWKSLITLGIAGGMLPCPSAIVVMISAIALGKVLFGMLLIVAFSLGSAGVLTAIGIGFVLGKRVSRGSRLARALQRPAFARLAAVLPVASALAVTLAGIGVTMIAVNQARLL